MANNYYVATIAQRPTIMESMNYDCKEKYNNRYKKSDIEKSELFVLKNQWEEEMKLQHGENWKTVVKKIKAIKIS